MEFREIPEQQQLRPSTAEFPGRSHELERPALCLIGPNGAGKTTADPHDVRPSRRFLFPFDTATAFPGMVLVKGVARPAAP